MRNDRKLNVMYSIKVVHCSLSEIMSSPKIPGCPAVTVLLVTQRQKLITCVKYMYMYSILQIYNSIVPRFSHLATFWQNEVDLH